MINNSIRDGRGNVIGYKCFQCGDVVQSMWGTTCNKCRKENERHNELISEIRELKERLKLAEMK